MELGVGLMLLVVGAIALLLGLAVVIGLVVFLFKLGVIGHYALKEKVPDEGSYRIEQSREVEE